MSARPSIQVQARVGMCFVKARVSMCLNRDAGGNSRIAVSAVTNCTATPRNDVAASTRQSRQRNDTRPAALRRLRKKKSWRSTAFSGLMCECGSNSQVEAEPPQEADMVEDQNNSLVAPLPSGCGGALPAPDAAAPLQHQQGALSRYPMLFDFTRRIP